MGAMVSSKVKQWTFLSATLPLVFRVSLGAPGALHLGARQVEEILLTSSQSLFAVAVLANLRISLTEAAALFVLFSAQLVLPDPRVRYGFSALYLLLAAVTIVRRRHVLGPFLRQGLLADLKG